VLSLTAILSKRWDEVLQLWLPGGPSLKINNKAESELIDLYIIKALDHPNKIQTFPWFED
jgi:hypothetical protein